MPRTDAAPGCVLALALSVAVPTLARAADFPSTALTPYPVILNTTRYPAQAPPGAEGTAQLSTQSSGPGAAPAPDTAHQIGPAGPPAPQPKRWTIVPSVNLGEAFNDNIFQTPKNRQSDAITDIVPGVTVVGDTPRLQGSLQYAPVIGVYATHSGLDNITQNLNAAAHTTLVEDTLFLDLRGVAAAQPTFGGLPIGTTGGLGVPGFGGVAGSAGGGFGTAGLGTTAAGSSLLNKQTQTQTSSFYAAPYIVHRFGSAATLQAGYAISESSQNAGSAVAPASGAVAPVNSNLVTHQEVLRLASGSMFGRLRDEVLLEGNQYSGSGVAANAFGYIGANRLAYAINNRLVAFAELGAEDIRFGGTPPTRITDAVWAGGLEFDPRPDAHLIVGYGHKYGFDSVVFDLSYAITARTTIFGRYNSSLGTDLLQFQGLVAGSTIDPLGQNIDRQTETPVFLTNSALGVQGNTTLFRIKSFTAGVSTMLNRDTVALALAAEDQTAVATTVPTAPGSNQAITGSLTWQHEVSPVFSTTAYVGIGQQTLPFPAAATVGSTERDSFAAGQLTLQYRLSEKVTAYAQYTYFERSSTVAENRFDQNIFLVGLSKRF